MLELLLLNFNWLLEFAFDAYYCFFNIRSDMVTKKHSELMKKQARDCYGRFVSLSSLTTPHPSCQEVGSSSHRTAHPPSRQEEALSDGSIVEM
jgi:hypothetical protein